MREQHFGRSRVFHGKLQLVENNKFVEALANRRVSVSRSFDDSIDVANLDV